MEPVRTDPDQRWDGWLVDRNRRGLRTALLIGLTLYPAFGVLDWLLAPGHGVRWLWLTRGVFAAVTVALFPVLRTRLFDRYGELFAAGYLWLAGAGISAMTAALGGLASPYYAGLILVVVAAGLLFVWRPHVVVAAHVAIVGTFLATNWLFAAPGPFAASVSNIAFLSATALIASIGQVAQFRMQREQVGQSFRLERATTNLERAHADLQQLDQFKSRFFANITHELRTPLAMVLTPLELLLQGEMGEYSESQRSSFQTMFRSALKLLKLINDLLDLSRLEESRLRLHVREEDLVPHLRTLTDESQVLAQRKDIALDFRSDVTSAPIVCDLERLERVFVNLLSNAIKFTHSGGHVHVALTDGPGAVAVTVEDDGPGFPPEQAAKLFERFYQVDMAGTRQHGGAGIGLALARELVHLHGGSIEAASDGRRGARFTVSLLKGSRHLRPDVLVPATPGLDGRDGDPAGESAVELSARSDFRLLDIEEAAERRVVERDADEESRPYTVVVVEDNPRVLRLVHMSLRRQFKILTAPDGLKGLELAIREKPNLVVTDLMMPGIDGITLTRRLREDPATRHIPVLMLTARGELEDRVKGLESGVSAYLTKPFSPKELVTSARRLVQAKEETADLVLSHRMESLELVAAGLAHEINNPLNYVKNALSRVRLDVEKTLAAAASATARPLDAEEGAKLEKAAARVRELLSVADSGLKRIGGTVELMGRYGRSGYRREIASIDAWEATRTVVGVVLPATGRKVLVDVELEGDGTLDCVPDEFGQVLTNLVQNAIEAVPDGGGRVVVRGAVEGPTLVLSVKDNGPGIEPEVQRRLFTPFFTTKGPGRGVGLGLTITRRVVDSLSGTLQVNSVPGHGAEFVVRVPRRQGRRVLRSLANS